MVREELGRLARLTGSSTLDTFFALTLEDVLKPAELERERIRRHVFLARYGRQSMLQWADVDAREVRRYARALSEFLREENEAASRAVKAQREG